MTYSMMAIRGGILLCLLCLLATAERALSQGNSRARVVAVVNPPGGINPNGLSNVYNKTLVWSNFFDAYPKLWSDITTALSQGSTQDSNQAAQQVQTIFQGGFIPPTTQPSSDTPGFQDYQQAAKKALIYIGLPGSAGIVTSTSDRLTYAIDKPFPIFLVEDQSLVGSQPDNPAWLHGPHVCLSRSTAFVNHPQTVMNVTYCTTARDDMRMAVNCWLPELNDLGAAISGTRYTTVYRCCDGFSLPAQPTSFPPPDFLNSKAGKLPNINSLLKFLDAPTDPDTRVCQ
ncbi:hypothetical protein RvY_02449 [Ramazzottius varieornatus]|uniref:Uncharacterized protein n=1 Tax=Ramazzottius varieornatus TaxID=947166 RepID=A0A1D1UJS1_RAMVA|nr:hypothetical protein RvY_02449 [Ramazzottius varieornatus]